MIAAYDILVFTPRATNLNNSRPAPCCPSGDERAAWMDLEDYLRLQFVNGLAYGVCVVPYCPW